MEICSLNFAQSLLCNGTSGYSNILFVQKYRSFIRDMKEKKEKKDTDNNIVETEKNNTKKFLLWNKQT